MGFQFPNSPLVNDTFTPSGGPTFSWNGFAWTTISQGVPVTVSVGDTPPVSPALGQLYWESDTGNMFIWYADADSSQWVQVSGSVSALPTADTRNRIVNPAMQISQENGDSGTATNGGYPADQWVVGFGGISATVSARQQVLSPNGSPRIYAQTSTAKPSLAATDYWYFYQLLEGVHIRDLQWGTASAKQVVVRFWIITANAPGTYTFKIGDTGNSRSFLAPFTIPDINIWYPITIVVPGDTIGTYPVTTAVGMSINFIFAAGSSYTGTAGWQAGNKLMITGTTNGAATTNAIFYLSDVGLYLDPLNTGRPPAWTMPDEADELIACKRYYQNLTIVFTSGSVAASVAYYAGATFPVTPRVSPTYAGTNLSASNISATPGPFAYTGPGLYESRGGIAAGTGWYITNVAVNARM